MRVLFVFTSAEKLLDRRDAGWYLPEGGIRLFVF